MSYAGVLAGITNKKLIIFGTGNTSVDLTQDLGHNISYYVDNDPQKWNGYFLNARVYPPEQLLTENPDNIAIVVASHHYLEIAEQLKNMGFSENIHFWNGIDFNDGRYQKIYLSYPISPKPRYGYGKPPHSKLLKIIDSERERYQKNLEDFCSLSAWLKRISNVEDPTNPVCPYWKNIWLHPLDGISIYSFLALRKPELYLEVGSGNSTKFARQAINDHQLATKIISIDPEPRAEIDRICDQVIREPLEETDITIFNRLEAGDMVFIDNSHCCYMNSDVTVTFMDVLPYLKKGVLVGFHDIFLPYDYSPYLIKRFYSEQYLLAAYLLAESNKLRIELPNAYITRDTELINILSPIWDHFKLDPIKKVGYAFWVKIIK